MIKQIIGYVMLIGLVFKFCLPVIIGIVEELFGGWSGKQVLGFFGAMIGVIGYVVIALYLVGFLK